MSFWRSSMTYDIDIPVPRKLPDNVKSAFLHAISFASAAFTCACGLAVKRKDKVKQLLAELAQAYREIALLKEEMELKDNRFQRLSSHRRPYYRPTQRMQILQYIISLPLHSRVVQQGLDNPPKIYNLETLKFPTVKEFFAVLESHAAEDSSPLVQQSVDHIKGYATYLYENQSS